jgi:hypothetical protein
MIVQTTCAITARLIGASASMAEIVDRAEATELRLSDGKTMPRVVRDKHGHVTILKLSGMTLSQDDFMELSKLERLRALVLVDTNVTDDDLSHLKQCKRLDHLNLTSTEVTDRVIDTILEMNSLKSLCLGNVRITSKAVERLKERNRGRTGGNQLRWGYSRRKD